MEHRAILTKRQRKTVLPPELVVEGARRAVGRLRQRRHRFHVREPDAVQEPGARCRVGPSPVRRIVVQLGRWIELHSLAADAHEVHDRFQDHTVTGN